MPSKMHEMAVAKILEAWPNAKTRGFMKAIRKVFGPDDLQELQCNPGIPDAFFVDTKEEVLVLFEVEVSRHVDDEKMAKYCDLWWRLDFLYWDTILLTYDRWGNRSRIICLGDYSAQTLVHEARGKIKSRDGYDIYKFPPTGHQRLSSRL
jgi:hypothetical protein